MGILFHHSMKVSQEHVIRMMATMARRSIKVYDCSVILL